MRLAGAGRAGRRLAANATLGQIGYGVEIVYTGGASATFTFPNFSLTSS